MFEDLSELFGPFLSDGPLAVFHLRDMALGNACQAGKLALSHPFLGASGSEHAARTLGVWYWGEYLTPGHRLARVCFLKP